MSRARGADPDRVLVIGLDGATFDIVGPLMAAGRLPVLAQLAESGATRVLQSPIPPKSPIAWPAFYTGVGPGKHGVFGFTEFDPATQQVSLISSRSVRAAPFWHVLGQRGKRTMVLNLPVTFPPSPLAGVMVTGVLTPHSGSRCTYPDELRGELEHAVGILEPDPTVRTLRRASPDAALQSLQASVDLRAGVTLHLMRTQPWDLCITVFYTTDVVQHAFLGDAVARPGPVAELRGEAGRIVAEHYRQVDRAIGRLLEAVGSDTTVLAISDHGVTVKRHWLHLSEWLAQRGFLAWARWPGGRTPRFVMRPKTVGRALSGLRVGGLGRLLPRRVLEAQVSMPRWGRLGLSGRGVDWQRTRAYVDPRMGDGIRINLKGREQYGTVEPNAEYEELRQQIAEDAISIVDPHTHEPVFERVYRREELYSGPYLERAPDLILVARGRQAAVSLESNRGQLFRAATGAEGAEHTCEGVLIAAGPGIQPSHAPGSADIVDLAPTILYLLDAPVPEHLDGRVLVELLHPSLSAVRPIEYAATAQEFGPEPADPAEAPDERVLQRLRDLGYL